MKLHTGESLTVATESWTWEQRELLGQRYLADVAEDILEHWSNDGSPNDSDDIDDLIKDLRRSLELDGYNWDGRRLIPSEADVLDSREETGIVQELYQNLGLSDEEVTFHHLQLTEEHYIAGRWDDSIANSRKFLESTLRQVAAKYGVSRARALDEDALSRPARVRDYLEREGLLEEKEKQAVASVYGLLSETGGHPYVAQQEQARLMRHLALTFAQFVMLRLRSTLAATI